MRKMLAAAAMILTLFGAATMVDAQTADPVGLIASAAILPFWATTGTITVFELTSLNDNADMHAFFFNAACNRVFSVPFAMSEHDALIVFSDDLGLNFNGLMALARSADNISAVALRSAITARSHVVDLINDSISVADAIGAVAAEDNTRTWNPLRSAASTITFPGATTTKWWFVCPQTHIPIDITGAIPPLPPAPSLIRFRVYDLDEEPLFDAQVTCTCLSEVNPSALFPFAFLTESRYVEMVTYVSTTPPANPPAFVMYRQLSFPGIGVDFGRAPGMSAATLFTGQPQQNAR